MKAKIQEAMKAAMKAGDKVRTGVLRMILADIQAAELAGREVMDGLTAFAKRVEKSIEEYTRLGKHDEVAKLKQEQAIVGEFLPQKMSDEELERIVSEVVAKEGLSGPKDLGRGMKAAMAACGARADGKRVQAILKQKLGG